MCVEPDALDDAGHLTPILEDGLADLDHPVQLDVAGRSGDLAEPTTVRLDEHADHLVTSDRAPRDAGEVPDGVTRLNLHHVSGIDDPEIELADTAVEIAVSRLRRRRDRRRIGPCGTDHGTPQVVAASDLAHNIPTLL